MKITSIKFFFLFNHYAGSKYQTTMNRCSKTPSIQYNFGELYLKTKYFIFGKRLVNLILNLLCTLKRDTIFVAHPLVRCVLIRRYKKVPFSYSSSKYFTFFKPNLVSEVVIGSDNTVIPKEFLLLNVLSKVADLFFFVLNSLNIISINIKVSLL